MEVLQAIQFLFHRCWKFFMIRVPGFSFNFAELFVAFFLANMGLCYLAAMIGVAPTVGSRETDIVAGYQASKNRRPIGFGR